MELKIHAENIILDENTTEENSTNPVPHIPPNSIVNPQQQTIEPPLQTIQNQPSTFSSSFEMSEQIYVAVTFFLFVQCEENVVWQCYRRC